MFESNLGFFYKILSILESKAVVKGFYWLLATAYLLQAQRVVHYFYLLLVCE